MMDWLRVLLIVQSGLHDCIKQGMSVPYDGDGGYYVQLTWQLFRKVFRCINVSESRVFWRKIVRNAISVPSQSAAAVNEGSSNDYSVR